MVDKPVGGEGLKGLERGKGLGPSASSQRGHGYDPPARAQSPLSDQPLALIKKRPGLSKSTANPLSSLPPSMLQQMRPSVITCASSHYQQCGHSQTSGMFGHRGCGSTIYSPDTDAADLTVTCDPVVEEHFRRSLGKNYQVPELSGSSVSITGSVDDHFTKALGDKWLQIKASGGSGPEDSDPWRKGAPSPLS
ncbi:transcription cofactor vestigial-like protein 4 [Heptranchias perlo]|uniref:transcription cofactor vestigial-like protein 4 n=1 Tax=Heptranchias perlo TaxID=212740 RepID=UPI003559E613